MESVSLRELLALACARKASDLHLTQGERPRLRVHGRLCAPEGEPLGGRDEFFALFTPYLSPEDLAVWAAKRGIDAGFECEQAGARRRFRLNGYWSFGKAAAAIRLLPPDIPPPERCGIPRGLTELCRKKQGVIFVTGPSGSGKSTTLASLLQWLCSREAEHVVTLEDPVEYVLASETSLIHQRQIGADVAGFAEGVRDALREDPDVICVGEMRDRETAQAALTAAETGHLVLATLHAPDAPRAVDRVIDLFSAEQQAQARSQLASTLLAVCSQRLLPSRNGRAAAFELMTASAAVRNAVRENRISLLKSLIQTGGRDGMLSMEASLARLAVSGEVNADEAAQRASDAKEFERLLACGRTRR